MLLLVVGLEAPDLALDVPEAEIRPLFLHLRYSTRKKNERKILVDKNKTDAAGGYHIWSHGGFLERRALQPCSDGIVTYLGYGHPPTTPFSPQSTPTVAEFITDGLQTDRKETIRFETPRHVSDQSEALFCHHYDMIMRSSTFKPRRYISPGAQGSTPAHREREPAY